MKITELEWNYEGYIEVEADKANIEIINYLYNSEEGVYIDRYPTNPDKSSNGGDYYSGFYISSPREAYEQGLLYRKEANKLEQMGAKCLMYNRMLYSDFADQGREIECIFLRSKECQK